MANATVTRSTLRKISAWDMKEGGLALAGQNMVQGCMCGIGTAGTIRRGGGVIATFNGAMLGRQLTKTLASAAATDIIEWETGIFCWANIGAITNASRGLLCYADDNQSVSLTNTNVIAGTIEFVD